MAEKDHNVVHWQEYEKGGHFFATIPMMPEINIPNRSKNSPFYGKFRRAVISLSKEKIRALFT
ncbi:hypothetical protein [Siminovitchia fordii]|uniref:Uncharacterized protein n=1 Tax=Siminovitchia fordii TaxID=254759 RepID=A0ABQ4KBX2_9BACI|nr:hypothetical protein [Siminovitchia fordii]GIN23229.1 hypothetical protein J1TS3_43630 [Siminovitchia fordii]